MIEPGKTNIYSVLNNYLFFNFTITNKLIIYFKIPHHSKFEKETSQTRHLLKNNDQYFNY